MAQDTGFRYGNKSYIECADLIAGPYIRIPIKSDQVGISRAVTETAGETVCNEIVNGIETEVGDPTKTVAWSLALDLSAANPASDFIVPGECKFYRVHDAPFDGTNYWAFQARAGEYTGLRYAKGVVVQAAVNLPTIGGDTRPAIF